MSPPVVFFLANVCCRIRRRIKNFDGNTTTQTTTLEEGERKTSIRSYTKIGAGRIGGESGQGDCSHEREGCPSEVRF